ncbi:MAG: hypothetical protein KJ072_03525 [Verrucomicrobia bacterium]|nr:hypothetical protein [Verrucomicrobiota bacterium]
MSLQDTTPALLRKASRWLPWMGLIAVLATVSRSAAGTHPQPWFERHLVGMEVGPTGAQFGGGKHAPDYARNFNGRDIVRRCVEANAEYLVLWVRDGEFTFHNSKLLPKPAGLGDRDVLREAADEARRHQLPLLVYCQLQYPAHELRQHPDWKARDAAGKPIDHLVCFHSPYTNVVKQLLAEMLPYGIAGFHLDMVDQGFGPPHGCWCDRCQALFQAEHGRPMPTGVNWEDENWDRMLRFRYATSDRFEKMLTDYVRSLDPQATVDFNYHGNPPFSWEIGQTPVVHAGNGDFVTGEAGLWAFGALTASFNAAWYRAATPGKPFQVAIQRGVRMYHDQTTRPLNDMRWEMFTLLAHGAFVTMIDKTAYDGWLDPVAYTRFGELLGEARAKRAQFGQTPVREVGIYFSARTRDWIGRDKPATYYQSVQGAHKACVYEHLGFGFVFDEALSLEALQQFPVVCLPNATIVSEREVDLFRRYVEGGGKLLITGQSGQFDRMGRPLGTSTLEGLIGAGVKRRLEGADNWMRFSTSSIPGSGTMLFADSPEGEAARRRALHAQNVAFAPAALRPGPADWPFLVRGPATIYEPTTAASVGDLLDSHRAALANPEGYNADWPLSARQVVGPAVLINALGKGTVLTFAGSPDFATASEHHIVEARKLFAHAVRLLHPNPRVRISAPANVEAVVTDDPAARTLRVHLIAYNATPQTTPAKDRPYVLPGLIEETPMFRASLEFPGGLKSAKALNPSTQLKKRGQRVDLVVEDIHEIIQCRY